MAKARLVAAVALVAIGCGSGGTREAVSTEQARVPLACGAEVTLRGDVIRVAPADGDDTANLQCALDAAIASGRRIRVQLAEGVFETSQLVAKGFVGEISGAGADRTVLTNVAAALPVTPVDFYFSEPGPENPWPSLVAFVGGDLRVSDLAVRVTGEAPTTGWSIFGIDPPIRALAHGFVVVGDEASATFERVAVEGAPAPGDFFGLNVGNGIFFEGFVGEIPPPIAGRFEVRNSAFRTVASGIPVSNVGGARIALQGNRFEDVLVAAEIAPPFDDVHYAFTANTVDAAWAALIAYAGDVSDVDLLVAGNHVRAFDGFDVLLSFGEDVRCRLVGNDVSYDEANGGSAVVLGVGTRGCLVATHGAVSDLGTDNRVAPPQ